MKMATKGKKGFHGQKDEVDRISDLPECILHHVLSFMGTKEACRTCVLSKKWANVWNTVPFLDFHPDNFRKEDLELSPSKFRTQLPYYIFIDRTMQRYSLQHLCVKKIKLEMPVFDAQVAFLIDSWLRIAVLNGLEELSLSFPLEGSRSYRLPEILFSAKSLKILRCRKVELPYYQVMKLTAFETLKLDRVHADKSMLQLIISSCPLMDLELDACFGLANISVPRLSKLEHLKVGGMPNAKLYIEQETGSLQTFEYVGNTWPCKIYAGALRNLKEIRIIFACIADEDFLNLLTELTLVDTLELYACHKLRNLNISSNWLKKLHLHECGDLKNVVIDAPNLAYFSYAGEQEICLSFANIGPHCDAYFDLPMESNQTSWFVKLKEFLFQSNICKVLDIHLLIDVSMTKSDVDKLKKILVGPTYELQELKLSPSRGWMSSESSLSALLDGLFWICHPVALSITTCLDYENKFVKSLMEALHYKVSCWKHPLKGVQVESIVCPGLNEYKSGDMDLNFRVKLYW